MNNAMSIFIGLGATALLSALAMYLLSNKLVDWMHGAEGTTDEPHTQEHYLEKELEISGERQ